MKPLIVLITVFILGCIFTAIFGAHTDVFFSGRIAMGVMLVFTAFGHFKFADGMVLMLPPFIPGKRFMVYFTGVLEIAFAVALFSGYYQIAGKWLLVFFVLITPANIYAASKHVNLEKAGYDGDGPGYLWFRIPLQVLFLAWVWFFAVMH